MLLRRKADAVKIELAAQLRRETRMSGSPSGCRWGAHLNRRLYEQRKKSEKS